MAKRWEKVGAESRALEKNESLNRVERTEALENFKAEHFTPAELELHAKAISNGGYHYLGSAKIMARIGKEFAEAMVDIMGATVQDLINDPSK